MILRLDPTLALVWRSPTSLQLGVDLPRVVLTDVTAVDERLLDALRSGIGRSGLSVIAELAGGSEANVLSLLSRVRPALSAAAPKPDRPLRVIVERLSGESPDGQVASLRAVLRMSLRRNGGEGSEEDGSLAAAGVAADVDEQVLGVLVAAFVVPPTLYSPWLSLDALHLPVVVGDEAVTIGPLVRPGESACLHCIDRHRADRDPAWPTIATQLLDARRRNVAIGLPAAHSAVTFDTVGTVARVVERLRAGRRSGLEHAQVRINAETGAVSRRGVQPHPNCHCLTEQDRRSPPGSATASALPSDEDRSVTRTAGGGGGPA